MSDLDSRLHFSVGEVAAMLGISPHTIRAWERRYRTLHPVRTSSGQRRYSSEDVDLLRQIKFERHAHGLSMRLATLTAQGVLAPEEAGAASDEREEPARPPDGGVDPLRMVANLVDEIVIVLDQEGRIEDANTAFLRFSDLLPRRVRGLGFADFIDPFDRAKGVRVYASPPRRRQGWELNLRGSRRRALFAFDCWPVTSPGGPRVILIGTEVAAARATDSGSRAVRPVPDSPRSLFPVQLMALLDGAPDPIRIFDLFETWLADSTFGLALATLTPMPVIVRSNGVFQRVAAGGAGLPGLPLGDLWAGRDNDPLAIAVARARRSCHPERLDGWIAPSGADGDCRVCEVEVLPLHGPTGDMTHLILRTEDAGARTLPRHGERLLEAVVALRAATAAGQIYTLAAEHARHLIRDAAVLVVPSTAGTARTRTIMAADGPQARRGKSDTDLRGSLVCEVERTGGRLDLQWDTSGGLEVIRAVPVTTGHGPAPEVLGVLVFSRRGEDPFTSAERDLMDEFADRVALALDTVAARAS